MYSRNSHVFLSTHRVSITGPEAISKEKKEMSAVNTDHLRSLFEATRDESVPVYDSELDHMQLSNKDVRSVDTCIYQDMPSYSQDISSYSQDMPSYSQQGDLLSDHSNGFPSELTLPPYFERCSEWNSSENSALTIEDVQVAGNKAKVLPYDNTGPPEYCAFANADYFQSQTHVTLVGQAERFHSQSSGKQRRVVSRAVSMPEAKSKVTCPSRNKLVASSHHSGERGAKRRKVHKHSLQQRVSINRPGGETVYSQDFAVLQFITTDEVSEITAPFQDHSQEHPGETFPHNSGRADAFQGSPWLSAFCFQEPSAEIRPSQFPLSPPVLLKGISAQTGCDSSEETLTFQQEHLFESSSSSHHKAPCCPHTQQEPWMAHVVSENRSCFRTQESHIPEMNFSAPGHGIENRKQDRFPCDVNYDTGYSGRCLQLGLSTTMSERSPLSDFPAAATDVTHPYCQGSSQTGATLTDRSAEEGRLHEPSRNLTTIHKTIGTNTTNCNHRDTSLAPDLEVSASKVTKVSKVNHLQENSAEDIHTDYQFTHETFHSHMETIEHVTVAMGVLDSLRPLEVNKHSVLDDLADENGVHIRQSSILTDLPDENDLHIPQSAEENAADEEMSDTSDTDQTLDSASNLNRDSSAPSDEKAKAELRSEVKVSSQLPPCRICAQPASGFHYGVNSCEACKGFFRRCLTRRRPLYCKGGGGNCDVTRLGSSMCAYCRYQRCQSLGMSKDAIRIGRYTHEKRTQNTLEVRMLTSGQQPLQLADEEADAMTDTLVAGHDNIKRTCLDLTDEDKSATWRQVRDLANLQRETFGRLDAVDFKQFDEIYRLTGLEIDNRKESMERSAQAVERNVLAMIQFAKCIPGFTELTPADQISLLKAGRADYTFLGRYKGFSLEHQAFASPLMRGVHRSHFDKLFGKEFVDFQFHLAESFKRLALTKREVILLKAIALTFPDRCDLEDYVTVEQLNWNLIRCFLTLLEQRQHCDVMLTFARVVDRLTALRAMSEMLAKSYANPLFMEVLRKKPVLVEMLFQ